MTKTRELFRLVDTYSNNRWSVVKCFGGRWIAAGRWNEGERVFDTFDEAFAWAYRKAGR